MELTDVPVNVLLDFQETDVKPVSLLSNIQIVSTCLKCQIREGKVKHTYGQYWKPNWHKLFLLERGEGGSRYTSLLDPKTQTHSPILTIIDPIKEEVKKMTSWLQINFVSSLSSTELFQYGT